MSKDSVPLAQSHPLLTTSPEEALFTVFQLQADPLVNVDR
jgi:hypothetical protein